MRAWRLDTGLRKMTLAEVAPPSPGPGEIAVRVHAVGVTPTELLWYPTTHNKDGTERTGAIPGHEFSGTVSVVGAEVEQAALGDVVYGMNDWFAEGATAERCITRPQWVAPRPARLTDAEAASVPISALTAWQGLLVRAKLQRGERVLIHGGSGAVGIFAIQLAHRQGAHVVTTASARNREFLLSLGANEVIDYRTERFDELLSDLDVIFDGVGGETLARSWALLRDGGRMVTVAADGEGTADERTRSAFFIVEPDRVQLEQVGDMLDAGELVAVVDAVVPFADAERAWLVGGAKRGKQVIEVAVSEVV